MGTIRTVPLGLLVIGLLAGCGDDTGNTAGLEDRIAALEAVDADERLLALEAAVEANTDAIAALQEESGTLAADLETLRAAVETNGTNIGQFDRDEIDTLLSDVDSLEASVASNADDISGLDSSLRETNGRVGELETRMADAEERLDGHDEDLIALGSSLADTQDSLVDTQLSLLDVAADVRTNARSIFEAERFLARLDARDDVLAAGIGRNLDAVDANADAIAANAVDISTNAAAAAANLEELGKQADDISLNSDRLDTNDGLIADNTSAHESNALNIALHTTAIDMNSVAIGDNADAIALNGDAIALNGDAIGDNADAIALNGDAIALNGDAIGDNADAIALNGDAIADNADAIGVNADDIALNADAIAAVGSTFHREVVFSGTTSNTNFNTLDLSEWVGAQETVVVLNVSAPDPADVNVTFREPGSGSNVSLNSLGASAVRAWHGHDAYAVTTTNSAGIVQWATGAAEPDTFEIELVMHIQ